MTTELPGQDHDREGAGVGFPQTKNAFPVCGSPIPAPAPDIGSQHPPTPCRPQAAAYGRGMTTIFSRIIAGEIPGRFVWSDEKCVAFLTAGPITPGHTLVVPREEVDVWTDAEPDLFAHLSRVAHTIGRAQRVEFDCVRPLMAIQGFEVNHLHLHVWPADSPADFDFAQAQSDPDPASMDGAAARLRARLRQDADAAPFVPDEPS